MINLFLYQEVNGQCFDARIYRFGCCNLVGIDANVVSKEERLLLVSRYKLREFSVLQNWLINFIEIADRTGVTLNGIQFYNDSKVGRNERDRVNDLITRKNYPALANLASRTRNINGVDVESIAFSFGGSAYRLFAVGILEVGSEKELKKILFQEKIWLVLTGSRPDNLF